MGSGVVKIAFHPHTSLDLVPSGWRWSEKRVPILTRERPADDIGPIDLGVCPVIESTDGRAKRLASLDFLRGVAAFAVAIPHYLIVTAVHADAAEAVSVLSVEVFFALSGFVLAPQIIACAESGRFADLGVFLVRRWMRTVLPYLVPLVVLSILYGELFSADFFRYLLYVQNLFGQHNARDYFPVAWSLSIEEWFYLLYPALIMGIGRLGGFRGVRFLAVFAVTYILLFAMLRIAFGDFSDWGSHVRRVTVFREDSIAYGFLLYLAIARCEARRAFRQRWIGAIAVPALILAITAIVAAQVTDAIDFDQDRIAEQIFPFAAAGFGVSAVLLCYRLTPVLERSRSAWRLSLFLGRISYSIYLFHLIVALLLRPHLADIPIVLQVGIYVGLLIGLSATFYRFYEKPILAARPRYAWRETARTVGHRPVASFTDDSGNQ